MSQDKELMVYVNGEMVPESVALISPLDRGMLWGDSVYDVERTFGGKVFKLREHLDRLYGSLRYTRIDPGMSQGEMERLTLEVVEANRHLLGPNDDFTVTQNISRGPLNREAHQGPTVLIYCRPMAFREFVHHYFKGTRVVTPSTRRTPPQCLSPKGKISNKMNHYIADFEAREVDPEAFALMLDLDGNITETSGANFMFVSGGCINVPNRRQVLQGITMATVLELAENLGVPVQEGDYTPFDVYQADEAMITTSSYCIIPAASLNGWRIGAQMPGPITRALTAAWSDMAGVNIVDQALAHLSQEERETLMAAA